MTVRMARIRIMGMKAGLFAALEKLRETGLVQVDDASEAPDLAARPLQLSEGQKQTFSRLERLLADIEGKQEVLGCDPSEGPGRAGALEPEGESDLDELDQEIRGLDARIEALEARREKLEMEAASLPRYQATLEKLLPDIPEAAGEAGNRTVGIMIKRSNLALLEILRTQVSDLTRGLAETSSRRIDDEIQGMLIVYPVEFAGAVDELLGDQDVTRLRLPAEYEEGRPAAILESIRDRIARIPAEQAELEAERTELRGEWCPRLAQRADFVRADLGIYRLLERLGETDRTFIVLGWTPARDLPQLAGALDDAFAGRIVLEEIEITAEMEDRVPVIQENLKPVQPFERLVNLLATPTYRGLDPSWLMAVFLPILFGMILGDAGYGVILLGASLALLKRFQDGIAADLAKVLAYGAVWSVVFGVLYGEAFGTLGEALGMHPILFHRGGEEITSLLLLSVGVGAVHILIGLVLGLWTAARHRDRSEMLERGGMLVGLAALMVLAGVVAGELPERLMTPSIAGVVVGVAILGSSMGWLGLLVGPIEFLSLVGNVLSYLRIAAIGLASVYLAQVANDLAGSLGVLVIGILVAVLIHALNIALGAFSPTIHSLRLHYVEFFRKFYKGGGRRFEPYR